MFEASRIKERKKACSLAMPVTQSSRRGKDDLFCLLARSLVTWVERQQHVESVGVRLHTRDPSNIAQKQKKGNNVNRKRNNPKNTQDLSVRGSASLARCKIK
jgi:hypothetical protein